eukprot:Phypoly_transcript_06974.p1 GENE.Phypoly_transcript_06974~~Phypoly_transcript_06974.p1  ORF type:complete len:488 (+),score=97.89 Phypoly_transcript_06974:126-1589(+)
MEGPLWDIIVIGEGISGCTAAHELTKAGKRVALLEASDRFGGRTCCVKSPNGHSVDLGGQWVYDKGQPNITKLLQELSIPTFPQHCTGIKCLELKDGTKSRYNSSIPSLPVHALLDLQVNGLSKLDTLSKLISVENPCLYNKAIEMDGMTVADLANKYMWTSAARQMIAVAVQTIFGMEMEDISALFFLFYVNAAGGVDNLVEIENGAQQDRIKGGTGEIFAKILPKLDHAILGTPVLEIRQKESQGEVEIVAGSQEKRSVFRARHVILAIPPTQAAQIEFSPPLPLPRLQMMRRGVMGTLIKIVLGYSTPFWRNAGFSGELVCYGADPLTQPVNLAYDACTVGYETDENWKKDDPNAKIEHFAIVAFISGAFAVFWSEKSEQERKEAVLAHLAKHFGEEINEPLYYMEKDWAKEKYTKGCPVVILPPGVLAQSCKVSPKAPKYPLREPVGLCHFAGTETATEWVGFMDGAAQSGLRAASEIIKRQG